MDFRRGFHFLTLQLSVLKLIDIHTHRIKAVEETQSIISATPAEYANLQDSSAKLLFSVGLHPWNVKDGFEEEICKLSHIIKSDNVLAIGEIGLDKLKASTQKDFELQKRAFEEQLIIAQENKLPIIIHNVKSTNEILSALTNHRISVPVIFHGFRLKKHIAETITNRGHYISIGAKYNEETLRGIPSDRLFLETDDSDAEISDIYTSAAKTLGITAQRLSEQIEKNYASVFAQ